jgi:hypothetical protein
MDVGGGSRIGSSIEGGVELTVQASVYSTLYRVDGHE